VPESEKLEGGMEETPKNESEKLEQKPKSEKMETDNPENEKTEEDKPAGISEEEKRKQNELEKYWKAVRENPMDFTGWTYLLQFVEQEVHSTL
jgi:pre-mRNA-processing factor 39